MMYKYYLTQRPPMPFTFPRPDGNDVVSIEDYDGRKPVSNLNKPAWGAVMYRKPLSNKYIYEYELAEASPFYMNKVTGEVLSCQAMLAQYAEDYDGEDPTNACGTDEYYSEMKE